MDFLGYSGMAVKRGRNRPLLAIRARNGLLRTSMSANCWILHGISRKSHFSPQGQLAGNLRNPPPALGVDSLRFAGLAKCSEMSLTLAEVVAQSLVNRYIWKDLCYEG